jgi:hypothetical protein
MRPLICLASAKANADLPLAVEPAIRRGKNSPVEDIVEDIDIDIDISVSLTGLRTNDTTNQ